MRLYCSYSKGLEKLQIETKSLSTVIMSRSA